jgi:hypothetical protein
MTKKEYEKLTAAVAKEVTKALRPLIQTMAEQAQLRAIHNEPNDLDRPMTLGAFRTFMSRGGTFQTNGGHDNEADFK